MKFKELAIYFEKIEATSSRLTITHLLAELFKKISQEEIKKAIYLLQGRVAPLFVKIESGMAEKMVIKSASHALNLDSKLFEKEYKKIGDIGETVLHFKKQIRSFDEKDLSILEVYEALYKLATASGTGSQDVKINILAHLIRQLDSLSSRYLVRIPIGVMRLGFSDMTVLDAFSWMIAKDKSLRGVIEKAYHVRPDLGYIGEVIKKYGIKKLEKINPTVFTPIIMMRAERLSSGSEIIDKIGQCAVEPKYDGFRLQIHVKKTQMSKSKASNIEVRLYSRNLEEVSYMYPDVIEGVKKEIKAREVIFEGEAIGFDAQSGNFLPFQETVQRKRKYDIVAKAKEIPLKLFAFELLYLDGKNYLRVPYIERRQQLGKVIKSTSDIFKDIIQISPVNIIADEKKMELMFDDAISKGLEGIIAKKLDGIYQPGARGWNWIKFKRSYSSKIEDTIDCLVMGYDYGKGKRTDFGMGAFLVGVHDEKNKNYVTVAKIGTGLSDEEWRELKKRCYKFKSDKKPALYSVDKMMAVDVWTKPEIVVEIKADEITKSPVHTAGRLLKASKSGQAQEVDVPGFALRFPRLVHFRDDRRPEDITTLKEVGKMYKSQSNSK